MNLVDPVSTLLQETPEHADGPVGDEALWRALLVWHDTPVSEWVTEPEKKRWVLRHAALALSRLQK